jgi:transcriptional regulator with XRE-family HTH domain
MEVIGKNIRFLRKMADLTQAGLAKKLGITRSQLSTYEEFRADVSAEMALKIADIFKITVDTLIRSDLEKVWQPREIENMANIINHKPTRV